MNTPKSAHHPPGKCPHHMAPPTKATQPPFPATKENKEHLQEWLLDSYKSSTCNTSKQQPIPLIDKHPNATHDWPWWEACCPSNPSTCPTPLAGRCEGWPWPQCINRSPGANASKRASDMVPLDGSMCQEKWQTLLHSGLPGIRPSCHMWIPSNTESIPPSTNCAPQHKEGSIRLLEWIPQYPTTQGWLSFHYFHHPMGAILLQNSTTGPHCIRWWIWGRFDEIISHVPNKTKCINDDTLLWSDNLSDSLNQAFDWLDHCGHHGIILNLDKFVLGADTAEFTGFEITPNSVHPCRKYFDAIHNFPTQANLTDMCSWFGLINQVAYAYTITDHTLPFCQLLKAGIPFHWDDTLNQLF